MQGVKTMSKQVRLSFRLATHNAEKLETMAQRYGVSMNSLLSMITAQWLDTNYDLKDKVLSALISEMANKIDTDTDFKNALGLDDKS